MTDLTKLNVSLTKHGAHKAAKLIKAFPKDQVLDNLSDTYEEIRIDRAQTEKNLSADSIGVLPELWDEVKQLGDAEVDNLVLIAIIFSHHQLIEAMIDSKTTAMSGRLVRGRILDGKAYTNFACILDELGFATDHTTSEYVSYNLTPLFTNQQLPKLVKRLLALKLTSAGWEGDSDLISECLRLRFHDVFSLSEDEFVIWLKTDARAPDLAPTVREGEEHEPEEESFHFESGHNPRAQGPVIVRSAAHSVIANLLHNEIQSRLYKHLAGIYGEEAVGTERPCGRGSIDVVVSQADGYTFYEIKTDRSIRKCIREAIPQLLEYAYWPEEDRAQHLIIVSQNPITEQAKRYLQHIRDKFGLPIFYQQFDLKEDSLGERY